MDDLESRVFGELPDDTWVYPGHGDDTTLGKERPHLPSGGHVAGRATGSPKPRQAPARCPGSAGSRFHPRNIVAE